MTRNVIPLIKNVKNVPKSVPNKLLTEEQLKDIMKRFDTNSDGHLDKRELEKAFKSMGGYLPGWRADRARHHADMDGDGYISKDELDELVKYGSKWGYTIVQ